MKERLRLPVGSDLAKCSFDWASDILGEPACELRVTPADAYVALKITSIAVVVDKELSRDAWLLVGATREVYSDGA